MNEVGGDEFCEKGGDHVGKEDEGFWDGGSDKIKGGGEDNYVEDVVNETYRKVLAGAQGYGGKRG